VKRSCLLLILVWTLTGSSLYAKSEEVIATNNEYGGITKRIEFSSEDQEYKKGIQEIIYSYNNKGVKVKTEVVARPEQANKEGWQRTVSYSWGKEKIGEIYSTDTHSRVYGFYRMVNFYHKDNQLYKREYYINKNSLIGRLGVYKRVVYYDKNGNKIKQEDLDNAGNRVTIDLERYRALKKKMAEDAGN